MKGVVPAHYDFSAAQLVVDVGNGEGELLADILTQYATPRGLVFDQPHIARRCATRLSASDLADRCEAVGGDFACAS